MDGSPPNHAGNTPLMEAPIAAKRRPKRPMAMNAWRKMARARSGSLAPMACATWTEKPVAAAEHNPENSHVEVDTSPMEAEASAPRLPTMDASIYCMAMEENCAKMAGTLSNTVRCSCCRSVMGRFSRIRSRRLSVLVLSWSGFSMLWGFVVL